VNPGMKPSPPTSIGMSVADPPGKGSVAASPSVTNRPTKSHTATSPFSAGRSSAMSSSLRLRWAMASRALLVCSSPGSAFSRSSSMPAKSGIGTSGITSISTLNSRSMPSAKFTTSILGCCAGRRPRSDTTRWVALFTELSSTSPITAWP
jgi:hypothetical protein